MDFSFTIHFFRSIPLRTHIYICVCDKESNVLLNLNKPPNIVFAYMFDSSISVLQIHYDRVDGYKRVNHLAEY